MNAKNLLIAGAAAALFLSGAVVARADEAAGTGNVRCAGINSCKGQGSCASAKNDCKGQNACKGQGVVMTSASDCKDKGGSVAPAPEKKKD
jgi:hypothetical protein